MILQEYSYCLSHFRIWDVDFLPTLLTYNVTEASNSFHIEKRHSQAY